MNTLTYITVVSKLLQQSMNDHLDRSLARTYSLKTARMLNDAVNRANTDLFPVKFNLCKLFHSYGIIQRELFQKSISI